MAAPPIDSARLGIARLGLMQLGQPGAFGLVAVPLDGSNTAALALHLFNDQPGGNLGPVIPPPPGGGASVDGVWDWRRDEEMILEFLLAEGLLDVD